MLKIPARAWVLALLSAGLQVLIFPHFNLFFLCWIAVVPLLYALLRGRGGEGELFDSEGRSLRPFTLQQGFLLGWLTGIVWYVGTCYWIYPVMHGYGNLAASVSYKLSDRLSLQFDALNLNNPVLKYYGDNKDQPRAFYSNGRQFYFGVRAAL